MRENPIGWIARAENSEVQEIHLFHKLQYAFMSMAGVTMFWFYYWCQMNPIKISVGNHLIKRYGGSYGSHIFERSTT